jgi:hypothetical protein
MQCKQFEIRGASFRPGGRVGKFLLADTAAQFGKGIDLCRSPCRFE